jgi:hypothetical protein
MSHFLLLLPFLLVVSSGYVHTSTGLAPSRQLSMPHSKARSLRIQHQPQEPAPVPMTMIQRHRPRTTLTALFLSSSERIRSRRRESITRIRRKRRFFVSPLFASSPSLLPAAELPGYSNNDSANKNQPNKLSPWQLQLLTLLRVSVPSIIAGVIATLTFPGMALFLAGLWNTNPGTMIILSQDSSQFVQNFLTVAGLLFSILVGQTCT